MEISLLGGGRGGGMSSSMQQHETAVRKGPWTMEEDLILVNYIASHGEGAWNNLARAAGLNRTGKSCRLRWLNYLRPDVRRGNITPEEQMLIVELQSRWGNRWSKIAKHLPGRTDNEIKNFWRTKIQKKNKSKNIVTSDQSITGYGRKAAALTEDQASTNTGQASATQDHVIVAQQPGLYNLDHQAYEFHGAAAAAVASSGGGGGAMDIPPEFLAESSDNFWALEDFWPPMQLLHIGN